MADAQISEQDLKARWGISQPALRKLVEKGRLEATKQGGQTLYSQDQVEAVESSDGGADFLDYEEVMQELQLSKGELDSLVGTGRLTQYAFGAGRRFMREDAEAIAAQKTPTGMEKRPTDRPGKAPTAVEEMPAGAKPAKPAKAGTDLEKEGTKLEVHAGAKGFEADTQPELEIPAPTEAAQEEPGTEGSEFEERLDTVFAEEVAEEEEAPPLEEPEAEIITDVLELGEEEGAEEDLLGDIIEDVGVEAKEEPLEESTREGMITDQITADLEAVGEETAGADTGEDMTAEITKLEEETFEDEGLDGVLTAAEEEGAAAEEAGFEVPSAVVPAREEPVGTAAMVLLILVIVMQLVAGVFAMANAANPDWGTALTSWNPF